MKTRIVLAMVALAVLVVAMAGCGSPAPATPAAPAPVTVVNVQPTAAPTVPPTAVAQVQPTTAPTVAPTAANAAMSGIANPASVFCEQNGGKLEIRKDAKGGEVGYCVFPDKSECEEWAFMRGECKPGAKPTAAATGKPTVAATGAKPTAAATGAAADPFAYCTTVGNVDAPDARWTGAKTPDVIVQALLKAMKMPADTPFAPNVPLTVWRCMNGKVYGCNIGANIPCSEKADVKTTPSAGMTDYCKANPTSDFIPAYVTGRATVYEWKCNKGVPAVVKELTKADARGFLSIYWYELTK